MANPNKADTGSGTLPSISPSQAIQLLTRQKEKGEVLLSSRPIPSPALDAWDNTTVEFLIKAFGSNSRNISVFSNIGRGGAFPMNAGEEWWELRRARDLQEKLAMLGSTIEQLEVEHQLQERSSLVVGKPSAVELVEQVCSRFHIVARQLRSRYGDRPTLEIDDEYDVQYLFHALLCLHFDDIRPEEWTPSSAAKSSRMDFLLKDEVIVVEVKKTRPGLGAKELGSQLIEDIERYKAHGDCKTLICFAYDPEGRVANPRGLERDLNRNDERLAVKVLILPKGM